MIAADFNQLLELEELDTSLYRGPRAHHPHLFGGHVLAQALRAASLTVDTGRQVHSLHGYFLRPGDAERSVIYRVEHDRDGGSFSARRVIAVQRGEPIFTVSTSFHESEPSGEFQLERPVASLPELADEQGLGVGPTELFEVRSYREAPTEGFQPTARVWARTRVLLPEDPAVHACALAYMSDFGSGFADVDVEGLSQAGPSLDHAMWFHGSIRADDWVLVDMWPLRASNVRGTYMGTIHAADGRLGTVFAQEALLRVRPTDGRRRRDQAVRSTAP